MGRVYAAPFNISAFGTAAGDILSISAATEKPLSVHSIIIGQQDSETSEMMGVLLSRQSSAGSGGVVEAGEPLIASDAADAATIRVADTADASGSTTEMVRDAFNTLNGWQYLPAPEDRVVVAGTAILTLKITNTPVVDMNINGVIIYEELV